MEHLDHHLIYFFLNRKNKLSKLFIIKYSIPISKSTLATDVDNCFSLKSFSFSLQLFRPPSSTIISFGDGKSNVLS